MPTVNFETEIEIEVYCQTCGVGLCLETEATVGRTRGVPQLRVNVCPECMKEKEKEIEDLQYDYEEKIKQLEEEIEILTAQ